VDKSTRAQLRLLYQQCTYPAKRTFDEEEIALALAKRHPKKPRADEPTLHGALSRSPSISRTTVNAESGPRRIQDVEQREPLDLLIALGRNTRMGAFYLDFNQPPDFLKSAFPVEDDLKCVSSTLDLSRLI
jgi:hypothetical protein